MALAGLLIAPSAFGQPLHTLKRPTKEWVFSGAFSPNGEQLAVGSSAPALQTDRMPEGVIEFYDLAAC
jgi:hypothetical protein